MTEINKASQQSLQRILDKLGVKSSEDKKVSKLFPDEESANIWVRNNSLKLSNKFTQ